MANQKLGVEGPGRTVAEEDAIAARCAGPAATTCAVRCAPASMAVGGGCACRASSGAGLAHGAASTALSTAGPGSAGAGGTGLRVTEAAASRFAAGGGIGATAAVDSECVGGTIGRGAGGGAGSAPAIWSTCTCMGLPPTAATHLSTPHMQRAKQRHAEMRRYL